MGTEPQLVMETRETATAIRRTPPSGIGTILLHVLDDEFHDERIEAALSVARACSAHISCVHVTPIEAYVAFDTFGGVFVMDDVIAKLDERDVELRQGVERRLTSEGVSWDYEQVTGDVASAVLRRAALADLVITAREPPHRDFVAPTIGFLGDLLHRSRTPLLIPAFPQAVFDPAGTAIVAWDGSFEAANAVRASIGLLRTASDVRLLHIPEQKVVESRHAFPATKVLEYLSRQGVHAQLRIESAPSDAGPDVISKLLVAHAASMGAAYMVMGAYSHSRVGEFLFGGVTRMLLKECSVPLVVAH